MSYIKRETLLQKTKELLSDDAFGAARIVREIERAPAEDVVAVVRCRDCENSDYYCSEKKKGCEPEGHYVCCVLGKEYQRTFIAGVVKGERTMSDKQKLLEWLNQYDGRTKMEEIIFGYMAVHLQDFSAKRINDFLKQLNLLLANKINDMEIATKVAHERATYLKCYLEGKMYENEEAARQCVNIQIENAQAILDRTERVAL